jgi:hypothetical protein
LATDRKDLNHLIMIDAFADHVIIRLKDQDLYVRNCASLSEAKLYPIIHEAVKKASIISD